MFVWSCSHGYRTSGLLIFVALRKLGVNCDFLDCLDLTALRGGLYLIVNLVWRACKCHNVCTRLHRLKITFVFADGSLIICLDRRGRCPTSHLRLLGLRAFFRYERSDSISTSQVQPTVFFLGLLISVVHWLIGAIVCDTSYVLMREREHLGQQIILVEVLQVVDLVERSLVLIGYILDLV